ncbi:uncharacterized protein LOC144799137 isoform X2 [Lissotriton helveticus]
MTGHHTVDFNPKMAAKRMTREIFDAAVQKKARKDLLTRDEAIEETLHELKLPAGVTRPSSRTERYDDYLEAERYGRDGPGRSGHEDPICGDPMRSPHDAPLQSSRDSGSRKEDSRRDPFTRPPVRESESSPFDPFTERRRSRSPPSIVKDCLTERAVRSKFDKDDLRRSRDASYSRKQVFPKPHATPPRREYSPRRSPPHDFVPPQSKVSLRKKGKIPHEWWTKIVPRGRGGTRRGKKRKGADCAPNVKIPLRNDPKIDLNDDANIFHRYGNRLIRWAGFDSIRKNIHFMAEQDLLFQHETEACSNAVIAFKLFLTKTYRDYCFFLAMDFIHPYLKCPIINHDLLGMLIDTKVVKTEKCFFEIINPFDGGMSKMQAGILKSIVPLLMACNNYELRQKVCYDGPEDMSNTFEKNVFLCRQSLVLLGQTFALATSIRQENVLESIGILDGAPNPTDHQNLTGPFLFAKEYIYRLKDWLSERSYPIGMAPLPVKKVKAPEVKVKNENKDKKPADPKIVETIGKLTEHCINLFKGKKTEKQPELWFFFDEKSPEYQYYRTKLLETQKVRQIVKDGRQQTAKPTAEEAAAESVKRIEFSRKVREFKTKLFKNVALAKRRRLRAASEPLQAPKVSERAAPEETGLPSAEVDAKTKDTAEKLATFVAQMGPQVEQFSKENSESNPEFWFLKEKDSAAYKYYQGKVSELRKTETKEKASDSKKDQQPEVETDSAEGDSAEAAMACEISPEVASQDEVAKKAPLRTLPRKRVTALKVGMLPAKRVCHVEDSKDPKMAAKRMTREILDAAMQKKARKDLLTRDEAIEETLHELPAGVTRPSSRTERYDDYLEAERYGRDGPGRSGHEDPICGDPMYSPHDAPLQSSRDSGSRKEDSRRDPFTRPPVRESESSPFDPFTERRRSRSPPPIVKDCLTERAVRSKFDKDDLRRSRDASYSREQVFRKPHAPPPPREYSPRRSPPRDFVPPQSKVSLSKKGKIPHEWWSKIVPRGLGKKRNVPIPLEYDPKIDLNDDANIFHRYGNQLIRWAGFDSIRKNIHFMAEQDLLFQHKTEACLNAVIAFKLFLTKTYRDYCFFLANDFKHPCLKCPMISHDLLSMLIDTKAVKTEKCFFEIINPFDGGMRKMQAGILKSIVPLLMACNNYELRQKVGYDGPEDMSKAFEKNVSLCRQSLVLLGQTFALATSIRQENVLESIGILGGAPKPTDHPNLTGTFLFAKEYIYQLKDWLSERSYPIGMAPLPVEEVKAPEVKVKNENKDKKTADPKIVETIGKLAEHCINLFKGKKTEKQPELWFLFDEKSPEYQYYRTKLLETQKVRQIVKDGRQQTAKPTAEEAAAESVKQIEFSRRVREFKTKLFKNVVLAKRRRLRAASEPLQAPKVSERAAPQETSCPSTEVDAKTKDTAEKLATCVAQMRPEVEQFSKENSESNPEFWFLKEKDSAAYKYYQGKVSELRNTETKEKASDSKKDQQPEVEADSAEGDSAEAAMACEISPEVASQDEVVKKAPVRTLSRKRVTALKVGMLPAKRVCQVKDSKVHDPVRITYEMPKGRPVLKKKPEKRDLDYANKKLTDTNVGFQMLSKMGWKEGEGLGSEGAGIKDPVKVGTTSRGEGLGEALVKQEDTFESFRQRMMQLHKQK